MRWFLFLSLVFPITAYAQSSAFRSTPYPLPRFVSLTSGEINVRAGPGEKYPVRWVYTQKNRPIEIILEYDAWRKIKDIDGDTGWVHSALLSGRRYGVAQADPYTLLRKKPYETAPLKLKIEQGALIPLKECKDDWCKTEIANQKGWIEQKSLWGVYERENFD